jgi:hypothetical protein
VAISLLEKFNFDIFFCLDFLDGKEFAAAMICYMFLKGLSVFFLLPCLKLWPHTTFLRFRPESGRLPKLFGENVA